ncbi:hypothetical protein [Bacillus solitudinis]|uniref:hypothetical protein n=1 Tax=Bacillus solitudinis TaxID=2014074 RepID=UPI000C2410A0|nr:hypothetical protein [Bacillus solitudinis]
MEERKYGVVYGNEKLLRNGSLGDPDIKHYYDKDSILHKSIHQAIKEIWNNLDFRIKNSYERNQILHSLLDEYLVTYESTSYFALENGRKKQGVSPLSEDIYYYQQLQKLSDYLLKAHNKVIDKEHPLFEYPLLSEYSQSMNEKREIYINHDFDAAQGLKGIHLDIVDLFNDDALQQNMKNKRLSEDEKLRLRLVRMEVVEQFPTLKEMQDCIDNINRKLGLKEATKLQMKEQFLFERADNMQTLKEHFIGRCIASGRENDFEVLKVEFNKYLYSFGIPLEAEKQYDKLIKVRNEIKYEMSVVYENIVKPVRSMGSAHIEPIKVDLVTQYIEDSFDFTNQNHVFALLSFEKESFTLDDEFGRERVTNFYPIYHLLKEKHKYNVGSVVYEILSQFDKLVDASDLTEIERDIIDVVCQRRGADIKIEHPYQRAVEYLEREHSLEKDVRYIKRALKKLSEKLVNTYCDDKFDICV